MAKVIQGPVPREKKYGDLGTPTMLVVHHGEGARDSDDDQGLAILEGYNRYHDETQGWGGIGYHFAVLRSGTVVKCRPVTWKGAHSPPNEGRIGVVLPGSYQSVAPTNAQLTSLRWLHDSGALFPARLRLVTHRENNQTSCPGDSLQRAVEGLREQPGGSTMNWWYTDPAKVRRIQTHLEWAYRTYEITPPNGKTVIDGKAGDQTKTQIKDWKYLLGYLIQYRTWALGTYPPAVFIDALHHPSLLGEAARKRGVDRRNARRRPTSNRASLAQRILDHPRALFGYSSPTGGTAAVGLESQAHGHKAYVASPESADTGRYVDIDTRILGFILDLCDLSGEGVQITCIVNGDHSEDSQHYTGQAVDIGKPVSGTAVYAAARRNGVIVLDEDSAHFHIHT